MTYHPTMIHHPTIFEDGPVATDGRSVPNLCGEHYDDGERETIERGFSRVAADWIENAVTRGEVDLDKQLLRGSGE